MTLEKLFVYMLKKTVSNVTKILVERSIHCLPCSYTNDVLDLLSQ